MASIDAFSDLERRMDGFQKDVAQVLARQQNHVALYERLLQLRVLPGASDVHDVRFVFGDDSRCWIEVAMHGDHVIGNSHPALDPKSRATLEHVLTVQGDLAAFLVVARDMLLASL
uniref:Kinetochore protein SPC25 n=2 Tax=Saccharomyces cerevisiae TaxID=4932 RepID=UPI0008FEAEF3|nr:Chain D, SPC25 isoform 1,SPC25 isoform 1 [Saccharomyces cerevisiae]